MTDWIESYTQWSTKRSPLTPRHFHQNTALALVAAAIAGRCYVQLPHGKIFPNLYTLIVARTSIFAKTAAFNLANELCQEVMPAKVFSNVSTPEALFAELSGTQPKNFDDLDLDEQRYLQESMKWGARRLFILDEAGMFFNGLKHDYQAGMGDIFMKLYDAGGAPLKRNTRSGGMQIIKNYCLSALFATTPYAIRALLSQRDAWMNGFWNRWNFVASDCLIDYQDGEYLPLPKEITANLKKISEGWLNQYDGKSYGAGIDFKVTREHTNAFKALRQEIFASDDERFDGVMAHIATKHLKAALIYATIEAQGEKPYIKLRHWDQAGELSQGWYRDARRALEISHKTERASDEEKLLMLIRASLPNGISTRSLQQHTHKSVEDILKILEPLAKAEIITLRMNGKQKSWVLLKEELAYIVKE